MKKLAIFIVAIAFVLATAAVVLADSQVFIVGGYNSKTEYLSDIRGAFPGSKIIIPERFAPIGWAADVLSEQLKKEGWDHNQETVFIAHSFGGLLVKQLVADNPEAKVKAVVLIGTPNRSYWFLPEELFRIKGKKALMFVVAGTKSTERWFLRDGPNDGVVELDSALLVDEAKATAVFSLDHTELLHSQQVVDQIKSWVTMPLSMELTQSQ